MHNPTTTTPPPPQQPPKNHTPPNPNHTPHPPPPHTPPNNKQLPPPIITKTKTGASWLSGAQVRPTRQRLSLASLLVGDGCDRSCDRRRAVHGRKKNVVKACPWRQFYNNASGVLGDAGLMNEITVDGQKIVIFDTCTDDHPHFFWEDTQELSDAPASELEISRLPAAPEGAEIARVDVIIRVRRS